MDKQSGELSLAVPLGVSPPAALIAPVVKQLFSLEGTQAAPVSRVRLSALTFRHAAPTYMEEYAVGSGGDYSLYQGGVVHLNGLGSAESLCILPLIIFSHCLTRLVRRSRNNQLHD